MMRTFEGPPGDKIVLHAFRLFSNSTDLESQVEHVGLTGKYDRAIPVFSFRMLTYT